MYINYSQEIIIYVLSHWEGRWVPTQNVASEVTDYSWYLYIHIRNTDPMYTQYKIYIPVDQVV